MMLGPLYCEQADRGALRELRGAIAGGAVGHAREGAARLVARDARWASRIVSLACAEAALASVGSLSEALFVKLVGRSGAARSSPPRAVELAALAAGLCGEASSSPARAALALAASSLSPRDWGEVQGALNAGAGPLLPGRVCPEAVAGAALECALGGRTSLSARLCLASVWYDAVEPCLSLREMGAAMARPGLSLAARAALAALGACERREDTGETGDAHALLLCSLAVGGPSGLPPPPPPPPGGGRRSLAAPASREELLGRDPPPPPQGLLVAERGGGHGGGARARARALGRPKRLRLPPPASRGASSQAAPAEVNKSLHESQPRATATS
jgi:hypothetical protein